MNFKSVNLHGYNPGTTLIRNTNDVVGGLISGRPAAIAVQEFGNSLSGDLNEKQLLKGMLEQGYDSISAVKPVRNPVNARLFFDRKQITLVSVLPPFYKLGFLNRQSSAIFQIRQKRFAFLSLYLPLYERYPEDKLAMWERLLSFVRQLETNYQVVVAGDFNESNCTSLSNKLLELGKVLKAADEDVPTWKNKRLDHIFVSKSLEIDGKCTRRTSLSDHAEITCEVLL